MADLTEEYRTEFEFYKTLSEDEKRKFLTLMEEDRQTSKMFEDAGMTWDKNTESTAICYLRNLKRRKDLLRNQQSQSQQACSSKSLTSVAFPLTRINVPPMTENELNISEGQGCVASGSQTSLSLASTPTEMNIRADFEDTGREHLETNSSRDHDECSTDDDNGRSNAQGQDTDTDLSDSESYDDCLSVLSNVTKTNEALQRVNSISSSVVIKKFPKSSFIPTVTLDKGGLFSSVRKGLIRGSCVKVKSFHVPMSGLGQNCEKINTIRRIFQLEHRNLIPMLGMIDVGLNECPQLVYASDEQEVNLLKYLRDNDKTNPKGYAQFGKFSCDIINACEYLHRNGIVHGYLSASSVMIRKASRLYGERNKERKLHVNSFLSDYGIIQLTDGDGKGNFWKASNGKIVPLRWVPKEILVGSSSQASTNYSCESDVWSFGVVLWEMWTNGDVPYGKNIYNGKVEEDILKECHPLTFKKPPSCPQHILEVMKSIFMPAPERPSFSKLKEKFDEFRKHRYERSEEKESSNNNMSSQEPMPQKQPEASGTVSSPAYERYQRVRQWKNQSALEALSDTKRQNGESSFGVPFYNGSRKAEERGRTFTNTSLKNKGSRNQTLALVCVPQMTSVDNGMIANAGMCQFGQLGPIAQAIAAISVATAARQNHAHPGTNNVNVNIDSQRFPTEQDGLIRPQGMGIGRGRGQPSGNGYQKKKFKTYKKK